MGATPHHQPTRLRIRAGELHHRSPCSSSFLSPPLSPPPNGTSLLVAWRALRAGVDRSLSLSRAKASTPVVTTSRASRSSSASSTTGPGITSRRRAPSCGLCGCWRPRLPPSATPPRRAGLGRSPPPKAVEREKQGITAALQLLDPADGAEKRFPMAMRLAVAQRRRCRKQMVVAEGEGRKKKG
ncbi:hypothetical protein BS78_05G164400 [Paspalum vaginatum]|nr:hypothetical protein BS78_05G164400 [Paspalum vaginatum]